MANQFLTTFLAISTVVITFSPSSGQTTSPCTSSMIASLAPCASFVTNSSLNATAPPPACCSSLGSLMSNGKDCLCQIVIGNVPFQLPIKQTTLAISLPRACNLPDVPLQCQVPLANGPTVSPNAAPSPTIEAPTGRAEPFSPRLAPEEAKPSMPVLPLAPTPNNADGPAGGTTPSAATSGFTVSLPLLMVAFLATVGIKLN